MHRELPDELSGRLISRLEKIIPKNYPGRCLKKNKRGRIYIRINKAGRRRRHRASAPGQTAANLTGNMRRNRGFQLKGSDQMEFGIRDTPYAEFLERGTGKMTARPSLGNTVRALQKNTTNYFARELGLKLKSR